MFIQTETIKSEFPNFSLNFDFENEENETLNRRVKKSVEDQENSTQFALRTWQAQLEQSHFVEDEKKPIEVYKKQYISRFLAAFGYGKYLIVPSWYASAAYHTRLVSPLFTRRVRLVITTVTFPGF